MAKIKSRQGHQRDGGPRTKPGAARIPSRTSSPAASSPAASSPAPSSPAQWQTLLDHYLMRARELVAAGDLIGAENCFQHAEHYFRLMRGA